MLRGSCDYWRYGLLLLQIFHRNICGGIIALCIQFRGTFLREKSSPKPSKDCFVKSVPLSAEGGLRLCLFVETSSAYSDFLLCKKSQLVEKVFIFVNRTNSLSPSPNPFPSVKGCVCLVGSASCRAFWHTRPASVPGLLSGAQKQSF